MDAIKQPTTDEHFPTILRHLKTMPVLELALLSLPTTENIESQIATIGPTLARAKTAMEAHAKLPGAFRYLQSTRSPEKLYVLGEWDSVEDHVRNFVPGEANQALLKELEGKILVDRLEHVDCGIERILKILEKGKGEMVIERWAVRGLDADARPGGGDFQFWKFMPGGWRVDERGAEYLGDVERTREQNWEREDVFIHFETLEEAGEDYEGLRDFARVIDEDVVRVLDVGGQTEEEVLEH